VKIVAASGHRWRTLVRRYRSDRGLLWVEITDQAKRHGVWSTVGFILVSPYDAQALARALGEVAAGIQSELAHAPLRPTTDPEQAASN
jgi:hypothetical protein